MAYSIAMQDISLVLSLYSHAPFSLKGKKFLETCRINAKRSTEAVLAARTGPTYFFFFSLFNLSSVCICQKTLYIVNELWWCLMSVNVMIGCEKETGPGDKQDEELEG